MEYKYNRQGERTEIKDQNGTVHAYEFDLLGRLIADKVTTPGTGVDTNVRRIDRKYEVRGMIARIISLYDKVNRLLVAVRGDLNAAKTGLVTDTGTYTQVTALDKAGNWKQNYRDDDLATPGFDLSQTRTHNKANEITQLAGSTAHVAHDAAGNMTRVPVPGNWSDDFDLTFDAWNRLVAVYDGSEVVAEYDGRNFRIVKTTEAEIRHYFYTPKLAMH